MRKILVTAFMIFTALFMSAQVQKNIVVETPGTLADLLGDDASTVTQLTVGGKLNSKDFNVFAKTTSLQDLDMHGVSIVDANGAETGAIPDYAFYKSPALKRVVMPGTLKSVGNSAFYKCTLLEEVVFSDGLTKIGKSAFMSDYVLNKVNLPQSVEKILDRAFYKTALSGTFVTPDSLTTIGTTAFYDTQLEQVRLGEKVSAVGEAAFGGCLKLSGFEVAAGNKCYKAVDGVLYDIADTLLLAYPQADARASYSLPKTVKSIAMSAFDCAAKLEELHINEGVAVMPVSMCYGDTVLKKIYMPSTTKLLKAGALDNCKQLAELHIRAVDPPEVETGAFGVMFRNYKMNLYVPKGSKSKYENASGWSDSFLSINEEDAPAEPVYRVLMTTSHAIGEYIGLSMQTGGEDVEVTGAEYDSPGYFKVTSQNIEIKGKITRLDCSSNQLTLLDVTQEPALVELYCDDNKLDTLKLGNLPALTRLYCGGNQLSSIDLSQLPSLQDFSCWGNNLTALGLNGNPAMTSLICRDNKLQGTLDLSSNPKINQVNCYNNALTFIKLAPNTELKHIELERNNINGDNMTRFMTSLPTYVAFPADEWDDYGGLNLQGLYVTEIDQTYEKNVAFDTDVNIAKGKGWPVYAINIDDYGMTKPTAYDGIPTTGITSLDRGQTVLHVATSGSQALVTGLSAGDIVRLYDLQGRSVVVLTAQGESLDIDLGGMARGVYVLKTKQGSCKIDVK